MDIKLEIVMIFTVGFALASLLGFVAQRIKLPYILGYLIAGYLIGPFSPGYAADLRLAEQLAEIGVILMLFGVGLHFKLEDLFRVKHIAIPGALLQVTVSSIAAVAALDFLGLSLTSGIIIGLAIGVASTVVLVKMLNDFQLLSSLEGHIAVGWLIVEDILTVAFLILLPVLAHIESITMQSVSLALGFVILKLAVLALFMFTLGHKIVEWILINVARLRSHELFTLTVLSLIFIIATGSAAIFGTSIALGAFIAGMVIGQTEVRHQALANSLPLKDVFAVIFFLSIGMLFNPYAISDHPMLFSLLMTIILLIKPLTALFIVLAYNFSLKIALTVAIALAQIGEFSFILGHEALLLNLMPDYGFDLLIACAIFTISINPLLFRFIRLFEKKTATFHVSKILNPKNLNEPSGKIAQLFEAQVAFTPKVVLVGYGRLGEAISHSLDKTGLTPVIIEQDIDVIPRIRKELKHVIFGDATQEQILTSAKMDKANLLVVTIADITTAADIIRTARQIHPKIDVIARLYHPADQAVLEELHVDFVSIEKEEIKAFIRKVQASVLK